MKYIDELRDRIKDVRHVSTLTENMVWETHDTMIWKADCFDGLPFFYNVYNYDDYYSYSLLALILHKGRMVVNQQAVDNTQADEFANHKGNYTIDHEINKIGAPHDCSYEIKNPVEYCKLVADAMIKDIGLIEAKNPGKTNIVMCGGRDSMNLLLLPWKNPVIALSAEPNYHWVCDFVKRNKLNIPVRKLSDTYDEAVLKDEVIEACCRANLVHWRWGVDLRQIANEYDHDGIIWKGQLGDVYLNENWKDFLTPYIEPQRTVRRTYKKFSKFVPHFIHRFIGHRFQEKVVNVIWEVCSGLQGGHMCFLRSLTDMLVVSGYHGPNMSALMRKVDFGEVCQTDLRPAIGKIITGDEVYYPKENPWPKPSSFREGLHHPDHFLNALKSVGVDVVYPENQ